jgi:hypothetical protein
LKIEASLIGNISLLINENPIDPHPFVEEFIKQTISGMLAALKGMGMINDLELTVEGDSVKINLNGALVKLNAMTSKMIKTTIIALVSTVNDVDEIKKLSIAIRK